ENNPPVSSAQSTIRRYALGRASCFFSSVLAQPETARPRGPSGTRASRNLVGATACCRRLTWASVAQVERVPRVIANRQVVGERPGQTKYDKGRVPIDLAGALGLPSYTAIRLSACQVIWRQSNSAANPAVAAWPRAGPAHHRARAVQQYAQL